MREQETFRVLTAQALAASAALGMLPFAPSVLESLGGPGSRWLAGVAYVLPALGAALAMPWWGKLADRWGTGPLLWRAQLGLALAIWLSAEARTVAAWFVALFLQGALGGSLAAAKAFVAARATPEKARRACDGLEAASRLAWVSGPLLVAWLWNPEAPLEAARVLTWLPLAGFVLCVGVRGTASVRSMARPLVPPTLDLPVWFLPFAQFTLGFTATLFSPFLVGADSTPSQGATGYSVTHGAALFSVTHGAALFSVTHAVCFFALLGSFSIASRRPRETFAAALVLFLLAGLSHAESVAFVDRVGLGFALALGIRATNAIAAAGVRRNEAGRFFGMLESLARASSIAGGVAASLLVFASGPQSPFLAASVVAAAATLVVLFSMRSQPSPEVVRACKA